MARRVSEERTSTRQPDARYRQLGPRLDKAVKALAIALIVVSALFSLGVPSALGLSYFPQQFLGFVLGATLAIVFVLLPARKGRTMDA